jgi:hypothetical protein
MKFFRDLGHHLMPSAHDGVNHCAGLVTRPITITIRLNNLALLLKATNRLGEAEPLMRQAPQFLAKFSHRTGHEHPDFRITIENYEQLLTIIGLSQEAIAARVQSSIEGEPM